MRTAKYLLVSAMIAVVGCTHDHAADNNPHGGETADLHAEEEEGVILLDTVAAAQFGVATAVITPGDFHQVLTVAGQVEDSPSSSSIVSAPTSGIVRYAKGITLGATVGGGATVATVSAAGISGGDSNAAAKEALDAAQREFDRVEPLYRDGIVTHKVYNDALAALRQARAAYSSHAASGRATAPAQGVVTQIMARDGQYVEAGAPLATVSANRNLTLRADVPQRYYGEVPSINSAIVEAPYASAPVELAQLNGHIVSRSGYSAAANGYVPLFFTFDNDGSLLPGSMVTVNLIGAPRHEVLTVPDKAISEQQGAYFVYERLDDDCYRKIPVLPGSSDGVNTEIKQGLQGGEDIVVDGMIAVRLAESGKAIPEGHSHNH